MAASSPLLQVEGLAIEAGGAPVLRDLSFEVLRGEILVVVGPSGCGKSTLLRHLAGLETPAAGRVLLDGADLHRGEPAALAVLRRRFGVMFQAGALWSGLSVGENLMLPMRLFTGLRRADRERRARFKLALVGLEDAFDRMPAELSGGMRKRAALARALALDPELLFLDEPGSGLDPPNVARLDELLLNLRHHLGTTVVMVTHGIESVFDVADRMLFLDDREKTMTALGAPAELLEHGPALVREFLRSGVRD